MTAADALTDAAAYRRGLEALKAVAEILARGAPLPATARETLRVVCELTGTDVGAVYRLDREADELEMVAHLSPAAALAPDDVDRIRRRPVAGSLLGMAARTGRFAVARLDDPPGVDPALRALQAQHGHRTQIALPIPVGATLWGVMALVFTEERRFGPAETALLEAIAHHVGLAVERSALVATAADQGRRLASLGEVARTVAADRDLGEVLGAVVDTARHFVPGGAVRLWLRAGTVLTLEAESGLEPGAPGPVPRRFVLGEGLIGQAAASRQAVVVHDLAGDARVQHPAWMAVQGFTSMAALPLSIGERLVGAMSVFTRGAHRLSPEDVDLLRSFGSQAALAIEHARLLGEARDAAGAYRALAEVGNLVGATLDPDGVLDLVVDRCRSVVGVDAAAVFRHDPDSDSLAYARGAGLSPAFSTGLRVRPGEGVTGRAFAERRPVWTTEAGTRGGQALGDTVQQIAAREGYRSVIAVPVLVHGTPVGALTGVWWAPRSPSAAEIDLMAGLAALAGVALHNAGLFAQAERRGRRLALLTRLTGVLTATLSPDEVLQRVVASARDLFGAVRARLWLSDADGATLSLRAEAGPPGRAEGRTRLAVGEGLVGRIAATRAPLVVTDLRQEPALVNRERVDQAGDLSFAGAPLLLGDRVLGVLAIAAARAWTLGDEDRDVLQSLCSHAAIAIENARLFDAAEVRAARLRSLGRLNRLVSSSLDLGRVLGEIVRAATELTAATAAACWVADEDRQTLELRALSDEALGADHPERLVRFGQGDAGRAAAGRCAVEAPDARATAGGGPAAAWWERHDLASFLGLPIVAGTQRLGVLGLYGRQPLRADGDEGDLLASLVAQAGAALRNARLYTDTLRRLEETRSLLAVTRAVSLPLPPGESLRLAAREAARAFGADTAGIYALEPSTRELRPIAGYRVPPELRARFFERPFRLDRFPVLQDAWRTGAPAFSADVHADPRVDRQPFADMPPLSALFAPTLVRGEPRGAVFLVWWRTGRTFTDADQRIVGGIAAQIGLAMENADLARQTETRLRETETLLSVSRTLASTLDVDGLPRAVLRHVVEALGADSCGLWRLDEAGRGLEPVQGYRVPPPLRPLLARLRLAADEQPLVAEMLRTRRCVMVEHATTDERLPAPLRALGPMQTHVLAPVVAQDRVVGALVATWWTQPRRLAEGELRLLEAIGGQAGVALERARLLRDNEQRLAELSVLHELSRAVTGRLDRAELLDALQRQLAGLLGARHLVASLLSPEADALEVVLRVVDGRRDVTPPLRYALAEGGLMSVVLADRRAIRTNDYVAECARRGVAPTPRSHDFPYWLGVPMVAGDQPLGVLVMRDRDRPFTARDERLLGHVGDLVALALRSARLFEDRTRALADLAAAQDQLVRTEKLRAMGEMASGVAHDFNNLLAAILGRAQLLLQQIQDPRQRRWLGIIERAAVDGAETVRRLQGFTRVRRDQPLTPVDLNQIVREALEVTEARWLEEPRARGIAIEAHAHLAPDLPRVAGAAAELREVLTNLVLNAVDAMPTGGRLTLATGEVDGLVELSIRDTGIGMAPEVRERIFDPFFSTKGPLGTGLGLSISYGILMRHGARISVDSAPGAGTTFRLRFPPVSPGTAGLEDEPPGEAAAGLRCLVIDDEPEVGAVLGDILAALGHTAEVDTDPERALHRVEASAFDVVFTDLAMPSRSGWQVARAMRALRPGLPVCLVSGFGVEVAAQDLVASGVARVLAKPVAIEAVRRVLAQMCPRQDG